MFELVKLATELERRIALLWKHGKVLEGSVEGDCSWVGEERAKVLVGREDRVGRL